MAGQISSCTVLSSAVCRQPGTVVESLRGSTPAPPVCCRKVRRRGGCTVVAAVNEGGEEKAARKKGLFSFVTDNESSRGAIQLPNTPAQDGNLGQMISSIEGKGRDYGSYVRAGEFRWFVRETGMWILISNYRCSTFEYFTVILYNFTNQHPYAL
jgi:hypothetical protein